MGRQPIRHRRSVVRLASMLFSLLAPLTSGYPGRQDMGMADERCLVHPPVNLQQEIIGTIHLKILLVEFQDVQCRKGQDGQLPRYTSRDFEDLLGSEGVYVSPVMHSPDGDPVFGSMNDYFRAMSGSRMNIHAVVINPKDRITGLPIWLRLSLDKQHYEKDGDEALLVESEYLARGLGLDVTTTEDTKLAIIYAGNTYYAMGGLNPAARNHRYLMSELQGIPYGQEHQGARFSRIGIHCHEFAHTIGIGHTSGSRADLMCSGSRNGSVAGNMPAPLNAIARMKAGWATVIPVDSLAGHDIDVSYSLTAPVFYRMTNRNGDYFLIESRRFDQMMVIGTTEVPDYNHADFFPPGGPHGTITQGLFVWRVNATGDVKDPGYSTEGLVYASGRYGRTYPENDPSETDDGVPFPGVSNNRILSPWSDPRNPYTKESDYFGSGVAHYTLYVPNTKGMSSCGMEILSEDRSHGTFRVRFSTSMTHESLQEHTDDLHGLTMHERLRTICRDSSGTVHQVLSEGGEVFYRRQRDGGGWEAFAQLSNGNGGNNAPAITLAGSALLVVWQVRAAGADNYVIHMRRTIDAGISWAELKSIGRANRCTPTGPRPAIAGLDNGNAIVAYSTSSALLAVESDNGGVSWSPVVHALPWSRVADGPSVLLTRATHGMKADVVFCGDDSAGHVQVHCAAYESDSGKWQTPWSVSGILPSDYVDFRRPVFIHQLTNRARVPWIIWDARDRNAGGEQVIAMRQLMPAQDGPSYRILRGKSQDELEPDELSEIMSNAVDHGPTGLETYRLEQNYPNPFNPTTVIGYTITGVNNVKLAVYDLLGREVATLVNGSQQPGTYTVPFDGSGLASGVYFCTLSVQGRVEVRKMNLSK